MGKYKKGTEKTKERKVVKEAEGDTVAKESKKQGWPIDGKEERLRGSAFHHGQQTL